MPPEPNPSGDLDQVGLLCQRRAIAQGKAPKAEWQHFNEHAKGAVHRKTAATMTDTTKHMLSPNAQDLESNESKI